MNPFNWLRTAARNAVIGGVQDAVDQLNASPEALTVRVELPAIAAPAIESESVEPVAKKRGGAK